MTAWFLWVTSTVDMRLEPQVCYSIVPGSLVHRVKAKHVLTEDVMAECKARPTNTSCIEWLAARFPKPPSEEGRQPDNERRTDAASDPASIAPPGG